MSPANAHETPWYDYDPALSQAISSLKRAKSRYDAQVALNIIMIILEHHIEAQAQVQSEQLVDAMLKCSITSPQQSVLLRQLYDLSATVRSAMQLLLDCPDDVEPHVVGLVSQMIEKALNQDVLSGDI